MPIEFRCTSCAKLLRTPDESAGKKAKCPECAAIVDVPAPSQPAAGDPGIPSGEVPRNPFAESPGTGDPGQAGNPYAAPAPYAAPTAHVPPTKPDQAGGLRHTKINFDEVLRGSFDLAASQWAQVALCGLVFIVISVGLTVVFGILSGALGAMGQAAQQPALAIGGNVMQQVLSFLVNTFFELGMIHFGLHMAKTGIADVSELFSVARFYGRALLIALLRNILVACAALIFIGPAMLSLMTGDESIFIPVIGIAAIPAFLLAIYIYFRLFLAMAFLVEQHAGAVDSLRLSGQYMAGNKLTVFLVVLVANILAGLFSLFTCCLGATLAAPFTMGILPAAIFMLATGRAVFDPKNRQTPAEAYG